MHYAKSSFFCQFALPLIGIFSFLVVPYCTCDLFMSRVQAEEMDSEIVSSEPLPDLEFSEFYKMSILKVPVKTPPGRLAMTPKINLLYNNYRGSGWLGVGWYLDMGAIQRSTKKGLNYGANDYEDTTGGSVELAVRTDWGASYYGAKIEGKLSKYYYNTSTKGWIVTTKEGIKYYYGSDSTSRQEFDNGNKIFKWCLDKVVDTNGNYMTITYQKNQGGIYPDTISYTANDSASLSAKHSVKFILEDRTDVYPSYMTGYEVKTAKRLKTIEVYGNDIFKRKYVLNYTYSGTSSHSRLVSVTQYGEDGTNTLPTTTFTWQAGNAAGSYSQAFYAASWPTPGDEFKQFAGDVNGDGKTDFMGAQKNGDYVRFYKATLVNGEYNIAYQDTTNTTMYWRSDSQWSIGDANGDGKSDFMRARVRTNGYVRFDTAITQNDGTYSISYYDTTIVGTADDKWFAGDVNGDGKSDFMGAQKNGSYVRLYTAINAGNGTYTVTQYDTDWLWVTDGKWGIGDVNGDGKSDFMRAKIISENGYTRIHTAISAGNGTYTNTTGWYNTTIPWDTDGNWFAGDVNGDGKSDFMGVVNNGGYARLCSALSVGDGTYVVSYQDTNWSAEYRKLFGPGDVNGDGRTDFMGILPVGGYFNLLTGASLGNGTYTVTSQSTSLVSGVNTSWVFDDFNGDGKSDLMSFAWGQGFAGFYYCGSQSSLDLLTKVTNSLGGEIAIAYRPSSDYTNIRLPFVLQTVYSITKDDGRGQALTNIYVSEGGYFDYLDREFRGFTKMTTYKMYNISTYEYETVIETWYHQDAVRKGLIEAQRTAACVDNGTLCGSAKLVNNTWVSAAIGTGNTGCDLVSSSVCFARLDTVAVTNMDLGYAPYATYTDYAYDPTNLNILAEHKSSSVSPADDIHTYLTYTITDSFTRPASKTVANSSNAIVSAKWMDYDSKGNLIKEEMCKSNVPNSGCASRNSSNPYTSYAYYANGNVSSTTDPRGYITSFTYDDATQTLVKDTIKTVNSIEHKTTKIYDPGTGNLLLETPPHLQNISSFTYTYDTFGRIIQENRPDGGLTTYQYVNQGNPTTQYITKIDNITGGASTG